MADHAAEGSHPDDNERGRNRLFWAETDDVDQSGHGQDRAAPPQGTECQPDDQPQGKGKEQPHPHTSSALRVSTARPTAAPTPEPQFRFTASNPERGR